MSARPFARWFTGSLAAIFVLSACGEGDSADEGEPLGTGWNQIPAAPYSAELTRPLAFWTGDELIVAGGYELPEPFEQATFRTQTFAYSAESGQWRELGPLDIPGYDGALSFAGTWTGAKRGSASRFPAGMAL